MKNTGKTVLAYLQIFAGAVLAAIVYHLFIVPNDFAPAGPAGVAWYDALAAALDGLSADPGGSATVGGVVRFELAVLGLLGLRPEVEAESGAFALRGERRIPVSAAVAAYIRDPTRPTENFQVPLDAARVIGVFYQFHLDCASDVRRSVLKMISKTNESR